MIWRENNVEAIIGRWDLVTVNIPLPNFATRNGEDVLRVEGREPNIMHVEPRGRRGTEKGMMIYQGGIFADCIKIFQDEPLTVIYPFANIAPLNKR